MQVMNSGKRFVAAAAIVATLASICCGQVRTWRDATGKHSVQAELVEVQGGKVTLKKPDGRSITVPLEKLSAADQAYAKQQPAAGAAGQPAGQAKRLRLPLASRDAVYLLPFQVVATTSDGTWRVKLGDSARPLWARMSESFRGDVEQHQGHSAGLIGAPQSEVVKLLMGFVQRTLSAKQIEQMKLVRVQVVELDKEGQAVIRVGAAAARQMKPGSTIFLLRPQLELAAAPELASVADGRSRQVAASVDAQLQMRASINNVRQIGVAMHNFANAHGYFPPAVIHGPDGKPWHSWRVLLLPFLGQARLYEQYRFDEAWDGPDNSKLIEQVPAVYRDPVYGESKDGYTHYAAAVGRGTAFPPEGYTLPANPPKTLSLPKRSGQYSQRVPGTTTFVDFKDGTSNSVLVGSVAPDRKIPWTKPEDVAFDEQFPGLGKPGGFAAPYKTEQGAGGVFVYADGSSHAISDRIDLHLLRCLVHIADLQEVGDVPTIPTPGRLPTALPVLELKLGQPGPSARLVLEPVVGWFHRPSSKIRQHPAVPADRTLRPGGKTSEWTCSMHPRIRLSRPGKCPLCGMDLIPRAPQGANKPPEGGKSDAARPAAPPVP